MHVGEWLDRYGYVYFLGRWKKITSETVCFVVVVSAFFISSQRFLKICVFCC